MEIQYYLYFPSKPPQRPYGTDLTVASHALAASAAEKRLVALGLELASLESESSRIPRGPGRSLADRARGIAVEQRLAEVGAEAARTRLAMRDLGVVVGAW